MTNPYIVLTAAEAAAIQTRLVKIGNALSEVHAALSTRKTRKAKSEPTAKAAKGAKAADTPKRRGRPPKAATAPKGKAPAAEPSDI